MSVSYYANPRAVPVNVLIASIRQDIAELGLGDYANLLRGERAKWVAQLRELALILEASTHVVEHLRKKSRRTEWTPFYRQVDDSKQVLVNIRAALMQLEKSGG